MKVAFPIKENNGLNSIIDEHFGNAKTFLIVDMKTRAFEVKENRKLADGGSTCKTGLFEKDDAIEAVITKCMGDGLRRNLTEDNIRIFQAQEESVEENLELLKDDQLKLFHIFDLCRTQKNKKEGGCGHHH